MAEIRVQVPDDVMEQLKQSLGLRTNTAVVEEALTVLNWAAQEKSRGRMILSSSTKGKDVVQLATKALLPSPSST